MKHLAEIVGGFWQRRVLVIGDLIADQFLYGEISRVSREAPVFILRHEHTETTPGGAGNCAANLAALGAHVTLVSQVGDDEAGHILLDRLRASGVECDKVSISAQMRTPTKVRVLAGQVHSPRQQVIRIDYDNQSNLNDSRDALQSAAASAFSDSDAVIISDYNYSSADPTMGNHVLQLSKSRRIPILVDSRFRLAQFPGFTSATPNEDEVEQLIDDKAMNEGAFDEAAEQLLSRLKYQALLITRGSKGVQLLESGKPPLRIDAIGSSQPVDVTGAGDTVIATYGLALAAGASFEEAARLANYAGGIVVMKRGTATVNADELQAAVVNSASATLS